MKEIVAKIINVMGTFLNTLISDSNQLSNFIILCFLILTILLLIIGLVKKDEGNKALKIGGIFLITFLAILSKNSVAYIITIFINATIIAKLEFLEKLAAIIFKNKDYFKLQIALIKSSKQENLDNKVKNSKELSATITSSSTNDIRQDIETNLSNIASFLNSKNFIKKYDLKDYYRLELSDKSKIYIDAIGRTLTTDFIYDVKNITNQNKVYEVIRQMENSIDTYKEYILRLNINRHVKGILVVPKEIQIEDIIMDKIGILKYDSIKKEIVNLEIIENWMDNQ